MKYQIGGKRMRTFAAVLILTFTGACGLVEELGVLVSQLATTVGAEATEAVNEVLERALDMEELTALNNGEVGLRIEAGLTNTGGINTAPGFAALALEDNCPARLFEGEEIPEDRVCTITRPLFEVGVYVPAGAAALTEVVPLTFEAQVPGPEGSSTVVTIRNRDAAAGSTEANIWDSLVAIERVISSNDDDARRVKRTEVLIANFRGCPDRDLTSPLCDSENNLDDLYYGYAATTELRDGTLIEEELTADEPATKPTLDAVVSGTYTKTISFGETRRIASETQTLVFDRDAETLSRSETRILRDGRSGSRTASRDSDGLSIEETRPDGSILKATIDRVAGTFTRTIQYSGSHIRSNMSETGTMGEAGGTIERTVVLSDGSEWSETVTVNREGETTTVSYQRSTGASGSVQVVRTASGREVEAEVTTASGVELEMEAREEVDGSVESNFWLDRSDISCDLNEGRDGEQDGEAYVLRDLEGGITGDAQFCTAEGDVEELSIEIDPGESARVKSLGRKAYKKVSRDIRLTTSP